MVVRSWASFQESDFLNYNGKANLQWGLFIYSSLSEVIFGIFFGATVQQQKFAWNKIFLGPSQLGGEQDQGEKYLEREKKGGIVFSKTKKLQEINCS